MSERELGLGARFFIGIPIIIIGDKKIILSDISMVIYTFSKNSLHAFSHLVFE